MNRAEVRELKLRARPDKRKYMENLAPLEEEKLHAMNKERCITNMLVKDRNGDLLTSERERARES